MRIAHDFNRGSPPKTSQVPQGRPNLLLCVFRYKIFQLARITVHSIAQVPSSSLSVFHLRESMPICG